MRVDLLRALIAQAVSEAVGKASSRGPVAVLLSGGIDSSTVATYAADLPLFTGWYDAEGCDERPYAALVAGGREWVTIEITAEDWLAAAEPTVAALDGLRCGPGAVGQYVVAQQVAAQGFKTVLTGEGGDELFGGYVRQMLVAGLPRPAGYEHYQLPPDYPTDYEAALGVEWDALRTLCSVDERVAGAHGLTVVPPLLDPWLVAHVHAAPVEWRIAKRWLRLALRQVVPDGVLDRGGKQGFPVPIVSWAQRDPIRSYMAEKLGYVPDPERPFDRGWWYDLQDALA